MNTKELQDKILDLLNDHDGLCDIISDVVTNAIYDEYPDISDEEFDTLCETHYPIFTLPKQRG